MAAIELNDQQREMLHWIADGCLASPQFSGKAQSTAVALRHRGLVSLRGTRPEWTMEITEAGQRTLSQSVSNLALVLDDRTFRQSPDMYKPEARDRQATSTDKSEAGMWTAF